MVNRNHWKHSRNQGIKPKFHVIPYHVNENRQCRTPQGNQPCIHDHLKGTQLYIMEYIGQKQHLTKGQLYVALVFCQEQTQELDTSHLWLLYYVMHHAYNEKQISQVLMLTIIAMNKVVLCLFLYMDTISGFLFE